jgi:hypothetical protein
MTDHVSGGYRKVRRRTGPSHRPPERTGLPRKVKLPGTPPGSSEVPDQSGLETWRRCRRCGYQVVVKALKRSVCSWCGARGV